MRIRFIYHVMARTGQATASATVAEAPVTDSATCVFLCEWNPLWQFAAAAQSLERNPNSNFFCCRWSGIGELIQLETFK